MPEPSQAKIRFLYVFFGANDACLEGGPSHQHVPLSSYKVNIVTLIQHPSIQAHRPHIFLITPPPINEYQRTEGGRELGFTELERTAEHTKSYADACRDVGVSLGIPVIDLWNVIMKKAGWSEGDPLPGSMKIAESKYLRSLLSDGTS